MIRGAAIALLGLLSAIADLDQLGYVDTRSSDTGQSTSNDDPVRGAQRDIGGDPPAPNASESIEAEEELPLTDADSMPMGFICITARAAGRITLGLKDKAGVLREEDVIHVDAAKLHRIHDGFFERFDHDYLMKSLKRNVDTNLGAGAARLVLRDVNSAPIGSMSVVLRAIDKEVFVGISNTNGELCEIIRIRGDGPTPENPVLYGPGVLVDGHLRTMHYGKAVDLSWLHETFGEPEGPKQITEGVGTDVK